MRRWLVTFSILSFTLVQAQERTNTKLATDTIKFANLHFYLAGMIAVPQREFRDVIDNSFGNLGYGFNTGILLSPVGQKKPSPVLLGIDFGYIHYGIDKIEGTSTMPGLKTSHNIYTWNGTARLMPKLYSGAITPFVDGMLGVKLFSSKTKIDKNLLNIALNDNQPEVINNAKDYGLNYGLGLGFFTNSKNLSYTGFSLRLLYFWGDNANYVVRNSLRIDSNQNVTFQTGEAKTSMVMIQLGFTAPNVRKMVNQSY